MTRLAKAIFCCLASRVVWGAGLSAGDVAIDVKAVRVRARGGNDK